MQLVSKKDKLLPMYKNTIQKPSIVSERFSLANQMAILMFRSWAGGEFQPSYSIRTCSSSAILEKKISLILEN